MRAEKRTGFRRARALPTRRREEALIATVSRPQQLKNPFIRNRLAANLARMSVHIGNEIYPGYEPRQTVSTESDRKETSVRVSYDIIKHYREGGRVETQRKENYTSVRTASLYYYIVTLFRT